MATYLTEDEESYPAADTMLVPETGDTWGGASAIWRGVARMALNRTAWIKKRIVKLAEDNILTGQNDFRKPIRFTPVTRNAEMFTTSITAIDAPNPATNRWQLVGRLKASGGQYVHLYTGSEGDTRGSFAVTLNAKWDVDAAGSSPGFTGTWTKYVNGKAAVALIWRYGNLRVAAREAADNAAWDFWGANYWDNGGDFQSETVRAGTVEIDAAVNYRAALVRTVPVPITHFVGSARLENDGAVSTYGGGGGAMPPAWQLTCAEGVRFGTITIRHHQDQTDVGDLFELWQRNSAAASWSTVATKTAAAGVVPGGEHTTTLHDVATGTLATAGELVSGTEEFLIVWKIASGGANNRMRSLTVERWEPGLRNS